MERLLRMTQTGFLLSLFCLLPTLLFAQKKVTLSGYMKDANTGESIIGANIYVRELKQAAQTNNYGFYSLSVPAGNYTVLFAYVGYITRIDSLTLIEDKNYDVEMRDQTTLEEVEVNSRGNDNVKTTEMGTISLSVDKIKTLPP